MKFITITGADGNTFDAPEDGILGIRQADGEQYNIQVRGFKNAMVITKAERDRLVGEKAPAKKSSSKKTTSQKK